MSYNPPSLFGSVTKTLVAKLSVLYHAAAASTAVAGILHLMIVPNVLRFALPIGIFFIVVGIAQLFWIVPIIKRWGRMWYYAGIGGTIVLVILFVITRLPNNPIFGRAGPIDPTGIAIEAFQAAFVGLIVAIIIYESKRKRLSGKTASEIA